MSQSVSSLSPLDSEKPVVPSKAPESVEGVQGERSQCTCPRCGMYRCYPALMLLSTILAGVFCWMYVTKPVFLSSPDNRQHMEAQPAIQEVVPERIQGDLSAPTAGLRGNLDPAGASLPGDSALTGEVDSETSEGAGETLRPLVVRRKGPALFRPFVAGETGGERPSPKEPVERDPAAVHPGVAIEEAVVQEPMKGEGRVPRSELSEGRSDQEDYQVRASVMADFSLAGSGRNSPRLKP